MNSNTCSSYPPVPYMFWSFDHIPSNNSPAEGWLWELISCKKNNLILVREITANLFLKISEDTAILQQSNWTHLISVSTRIFPEFPAYNPQKNILQSPSQHEAIDEAGLGLPLAPNARHGLSVVVGHLWEMESRTPEPGPHERWYAATQYRAILDWCLWQDRHFIDAYDPLRWNSETPMA